MIVGIFYYKVKIQVSFVKVVVFSTMRLSAWRHLLSGKPVLSMDTILSRFRSSSGYVFYFVKFLLRPYDVTTT